MRSLKPSLLPLVATRLVFFTATGVVKLLVVKADMELDRMGWEFKCHNTVAFTFSSLSWINSPWIVARLWLISKV